MEESTSAKVIAIVGFALILGILLLAWIAVGH